MYFGYLNFVIRKHYHIIFFIDYVVWWTLDIRQVICYLAVYHNYVLQKVKHFPVHKDA